MRKSDDCDWFHTLIPTAIIVHQKDRSDQVAPCSHIGLFNKIGCFVMISDACVDSAFIVFVLGGLRRTPVARFISVVVCFW